MGRGHLAGRAPCSPARAAHGRCRHAEAALLPVAVIVVRGPIERMSAIVEADEAVGGSR